jgi:hypothetical protein
MRYARVLIEKGASEEIAYAIFSIVLLLLNYTVTFEFPDVHQILFDVLLKALSRLEMQAFGRGWGSV